jgi:hypothetical protein
VINGHGDVKILYANWKGRNCKPKQVENVEGGENEVKEGG